MIARLLFAFAVAVVVTEVLAAAASTQFVLARLVELDVRVPFDVRLATTARDVVGMAGTYLPIIAIGQAIAFVVCAAVVRRLSPLWARIGYPLAGFCAVTVALALMIQLLEITPVAGARSALGFLVQGLAGAVGGWLFARLRPGALPAGG